jgi:hypothetical protein
MPDAVYKETVLTLRSRGVMARYPDDQIPQMGWANLDNVEELEETALGPRLGSTLITKTGTVVNPLNGVVNSLQKLTNITPYNPQGSTAVAWRYAGTNAGTLYRLAGLAPGTYVSIATGLSGNPWGSAVANTQDAPAPFLFIGDANKMLKDNGLNSAAQQMGIFQPQYPVQAQVQQFDEIILDAYPGPSGGYTYTGIGGGTIGQSVNTTLTSVVNPGLQTPSVAAPTQIGQFQVLTIDTGGNQETVIALAVTATGFTAFFTKAHSIGAAVVSADLSVTVPASTTATVAKSFGGTPIAAWPATLDQSDYIGLYLYCSDPTQIQSITIKFDCGDGTFNTDYFYKTIAQGPLQQLLSTTTAPDDAASDAILYDSLGTFGNNAGGVAELQTGLDTWTPLFLQLEDFAGSGRAAFADPVFNWEAVNGYQVTITTTAGTGATIKFASLILVGGAGPDVFAGVAYDYMFTYYNTIDQTESNPSMAMSNVNPPNQTNWVYPRRQPVLLTMICTTTDPQVNALRIYRRGGTLGDNYRRVDQIPYSGPGNVQYTDLTSDASLAASDIISFTNDVPVTSTLPYPIDTVLFAAIATTNAVASFAIPNTFQNIIAIQIGQQMTLGNPTAPANNFETVIVLSYVTTLTHIIITAFVQNTHAAGEPVQATAKYGQPVTILCWAFDQMWYAGDPNNPNYLYWSNKSAPQAVSSAANVPVGAADDRITAIYQFKGNLYVSTLKGMWAIAPGSNASQAPTVYPTACKHGCVAQHGIVVTEEAVYFQSLDGIRAFAGGASQYLSQEIEFIFQGVGTTPIVEADQTQLAATRMAYWNNMIFVSYVGLDGNRHRLVLHSEYKRWRNDDIDAQSLFLEADTNTLVFGDSNGLVHIDRQDVAYDEENALGAVAQVPISLNLQSPSYDQGLPDIQKNYQELTLDINTLGQTVDVYLFVDEGGNQLINTVTTTVRTKFNFVLNEGFGLQGYRIGFLITGSVSQQILIYQASIKSLPLAKTRLSFDTYDLSLGGPDSKILRDVFFEYNAASPISFGVYYDNAATPGYTFTLPAVGTFIGLRFFPTRTIRRVRLPAVSFRLIRFIGTSTANFQIWDSSSAYMKFQCQGRGYQRAPFVPN